ncbi:MAG: hypothetical protein R3F49_15020 [Planctomycetota bacterium]
MQRGPLMMIGACWLAAATLTASAAAYPQQKLLDRSKPFQAHANDPYTRGGDPALVAAAGYVNFGQPFEFGAEGWDTTRISKELDAPIIWLETAHLQLGFQIPGIKVDPDDRDKIRAELERLQLKLPDVEPKTRFMDPWLRAHLFAQRLEEHYTKFRDFLGFKDEDFPDGTKLWNTQGKYMGQGPYLGEKGKYEVIVLPGLSQYRSFLTASYGLTTKKPQRWNVIPRDTMQYAVHLDEGKLKLDAALHNNLIFNQTINYFDGFQHYSYEGPVWLREGLGHWFERDNDPRFNTFDSSEGGQADMFNKVDWEPEVVKLIAKGDAPTMAQLVNLRNYAEMDKSHHLATWSIIDFLIRAHPEFVPKLIDAVKGLVNAEFRDDGTEMPNVQREAFKELLGWSYGQLDTAWQEFVTTNYRTK